jgi:hypothetical protein
MMIQRWLLLAGAFSLAWAGALAAQPDALASSTEMAADDWNPPAAGPLTAWTAPLCGAHKFVPHFFLSYSRTRGAYDDAGSFAELPSGEEASAWQQQLVLQYGFTDTLELDASTALLEKHAKIGGDSADSTGLADSTLALRYCLREDSGWYPHVTAHVQLHMPTGKYQDADPAKLGTDITGTGSWDPGLAINATKKLKPFLIHADFIYSFPIETSVDGQKTQNGQYGNYDLALEYILPAGFELMAEANGCFQAGQKVEGRDVPATQSRSLMLTPGVGWSNDTIQTLIGYQRSVWGVNTDAVDAVVATVIYPF